MRPSLSKKAKPFPTKDAACCSARIVRQGRTIRTFTGREVFSPTHMSPEKINFDFFAPAGANSNEVFAARTVG